MPTPTLFLSFSILLKVAEGIGYAMYATASLTRIIIMVHNHMYIQNLQTPK